MRRRVLILDFDFFTSVGGGQVFYRRIVERNPSIDFYYLSSGSDLRLKSEGSLPPNAHPSFYDPRLDIAFDRGSASDWLYQHQTQKIACAAAALKGMTFHVVDVPSFFPVAQLVRPVMSSFGITVEKVAVALVGWLSVSMQNAYEDLDPDTLHRLEAAEAGSLESADVRYTISHLEFAENARTELPVTIVDMHDAIESFGLPEPAPPGEGPPDLWYVGRLDGAKGPDLFIELVSRIPRHLYNGCFLSGPDNTWSVDGERWSEYLLNLARSRDVPAVYEGMLSDAEIRRRVYRGRTVMVVPSRNDAFNFVALEAVLNACPLLLSERAGACGFLRREHPDLLPPTMVPENLDSAAEKLQDLLSRYQEISERARRRLAEKPFPQPRQGFMDAIYEAPSVSQPAQKESMNRESISLRRQLALTPSLREWSPVRSAVARPRVTAILQVSGGPVLLAPVLASLVRQSLEELEIVVIDNGSSDAAGVLAVAEDFGPAVRVVRTGASSYAEAASRGLATARGEFVCFLTEEDICAPELFSEAVRILDSQPQAAGVYPDWDSIDASGYLIATKLLPEFSRELMLRAHWCIPGPGTVVRREVLQRAGGWDTSFQFLSGFDLWLRATAQAPMIHLPEKLAYQRLLTSGPDNRMDRMKMAEEHVRLITRFFMDSGEAARCSYLRLPALAAASLTAAAVLTGDPDDQEMRSGSRRYLQEALRLDPGLMQNLPPNLAGYRNLWPDIPSPAQQVRQTDFQLVRKNAAAGLNDLKNCCLVSDVPPCTDDSRGRFLDAMLAATGAQWKTGFIVLNPKSKPRLSALAEEMDLVSRPEESDPEGTGKLVARLLRFAERAHVRSYWVLAESPTMIRLADELMRNTRLPVFVQMTEPPAALPGELRTMFEAVLRRSAGCAAASWSMAEAYERKFSARCVPVLPSLPDWMAKPPATAARRASVFRIGFAGPLRAAAEWERLLRILDTEDWHIGLAQIEVHAFTEDEITETRKRLGRSFRHNLPDSARELTDALSEMDLLYLPCRFEAEHADQVSLSFPPELTEYLAAGRPVLIHGPSYASPVRFVKTWEAAIVCDTPADSALLTVLKRAVCDPAEYRKTAAGGSRAFHECLTLDTLESSVLEVLSGTGAVDTEPLAESLSARV